MSSGFLPTVREHSTRIASASAFAYVSPAVQSEATHSGGGDGQEVQFSSPPSFFYSKLLLLLFCVYVPSFLYSCAAVAAAYKPILFVDSRRDTQKSIHSTLHTAERITMERATRCHHRRRRRHHHRRYTPCTPRSISKSQATKAK